MGSMETPMLKGAEAWHDNCIANHTEVHTLAS
uniref:Uncharacterized protein n=1 Tax=Anguilla anguilla TaxID=7936 RepID=A0A0E9URK7_ANGAN